jgi:hypothetical protein
MPLNAEGLPVFSDDCPARGDYRHDWPVSPDRFHVSGLEGAPEGRDIITAGFGHVPPDRGRKWRYAEDIGDTVPEAAGARLRALNADQIRAVGSVLCNKIGECLGAQIDQAGFPFCPAYNAEAFLDTVNQMYDH